MTTKIFRLISPWSFLRERTLEFQFTAPSFIAPEKVQFRYMLEGFDKDWTQAGNRRVAYYTNIPPAEYHFRVRRGNDQIWSTEGPGSRSPWSLISTRQRLSSSSRILLVLSLCAGAYGCALTS